jgi:hypothetical protein
VEDVEELASGAPEQRAGHRPPSWVLLVGVALVVGWFLLPDTTTSPVGRASPALVTSPSPPPGYQPGYHESVPTLESVCTPVTDGRSRLSLRFVLINRTADDLEITAVRPILAMGGLQLSRLRVVSGGCRAPLDEPLDKPLDSGSEALVVFDFTLPDECPQPYPVGALVTSHVPGLSRSGTDTEIPVYPDLGSIRFASCPGVG